MPRRPRTSHTIRRVDTFCDIPVPSKHTLDVLVDPSSPHLLAALQHAMAAQDEATTRKPTNPVLPYLSPSPPLQETVSALTSIAAGRPSPGRSPTAVGMIKVVIVSCPQNAQ